MAKLTGLTKALSKGKKTLTAKQKAAALAKAKAKAKSKVEKSLSKGPLVSTLSKKSQEADRPKRLDFYRKQWEAEELDKLSLKELDSITRKIDKARKAKDKTKDLPVGLIQGNPQGTRMKSVARMSFPMSRKMGRKDSDTIALYEAQDAIRRLAKKAGITVSAWRRKNPNSKHVKTLYRIKPNIKVKDKK
tara:strand:- start:28 stop:597 length:570 start_codon:yes stop_codon:yes gene_type:complete